MTPFEGGPIDATATSGSASGSWPQPPATQGAEAQSHGGYLPDVPEGIVAVLYDGAWMVDIDRDWLAALLSDAEQRGLEAGRGDLAHWEAVWKAEERERIAAAIEARLIPFDKRPAPGRHQARAESVAYNSGIRDAASIARSVEGGE